MLQDTRNSGRVVATIRSGACAPRSARRGFDTVDLKEAKALLEELAV
jgi:hypothetical protein